MKKHSVAVLCIIAVVTLVMAGCGGGGLNLKPSDASFNPENVKTLSLQSKLTRGDMTDEDQTAVKELLKAEIEKKYPGRLESISLDPNQPADITILLDITQCVKPNEAMRMMGGAVSIVANVIVKDASGKQLSKAQVSTIKTQNVATKITMGMLEAEFVKTLVPAIGGLLTSK